jgi:PAS domain S-box-containing protein
VIWRKNKTTSVLTHAHTPAVAPAWFVCVLRTVLVVLLLPSLSAAQSGEPKRVLLLMQEDVSWPVFRLLDENVRSTLREGLPGGVVIFSEHLDRSHFQDTGIQAKQMTWIKKKYANSNLNLVMSVGDVPTDLFPGVPLVLLSANPRRKPPTATFARYASVWVDIEAQKTLELAEKLQPDARRIVVIGDGAPSDDTILNRLRSRHPTTAGDIPISYVTNPVVSEICQRVSELGMDSIVLFTSLTEDEHGQPLISAEVIPRIAAVSGAPVYVLFDTHMGSGAVGGYVSSFAEVGKAGGQLGLRLLAGDHPEDVVAQNVYLFDWRQLRRWHIPESKLPAGSIVIDRPLTGWEKYRRYFIPSILVFFLLGLLIGGLLWQRARKREFQRSLFDQRAFEKMVSQLSTKFIDLPEDEVDLTIKKSLRRIAEFLKLDRIAIYESVPPTTELHLAFSWYGEQIQPVLSTVNADALPWWRDSLLRGKSVLVSTLEELPAEASAEKEHLQKLGSISVAVFPLRAGDDFFGCISFATTKRRVLWTGDLTEQLKLLSDIISNALVRKRAEEVRSRHVAIVESSNDAIISENLDGIILSWNAGAQRLFEYAEEEAIGRSITIIVPEELREEENQIVERLRAGERIEQHETVRVTKGGRRLNASLTLSPVRDSHGAVVGVSKIARDITERKRAEQVLRESEGRFRLVADTAPVLIWMSDSDKLCTFFNQSWLNFTGRSLEQELGEGWAAGVHPADVDGCLQTYSAAFDARVDFQIEYRLRRFDGVYRWVMDFGVPRFESDGTFRGYIGSCVDITDRKTSEESVHSLTGRLISAQEEERNRIARELHDDFSQRLALLSIELGQLSKRLSQSQSDERASVLQMLAGTKEISSDLHALSHQLHSSKLEHVGLAAAILGLCKDIDHRYKIEIQFTQHECPPDIPKDAALCLFRVAQEGLANVVKHSESSGAQVALRGGQGALVLRISDQGRGFDTRLHNSTTGIGMIGMSERLRLVGGKLVVKSQPGLGTEILAEIPLIAVNDSRTKTQAAGR